MSDRADGAEPGRAGGVTLRITPGSIAIAATVIALVFAARLIVLSATRALGWIVMAVLIAALLYPAVAWLVRRRWRRGPAVVITLLGAVIVASALLALVASAGRRAFGTLEVAAPEAAAEIESSDTWYGHLAADIDLRSKVEEAVAGIPVRLAGGEGAAALRTASTRGVALLIVLVLVGFLLSAGDRVVRGGLRQVPDAWRRDVSAWLFAAYRRTWRYATGIAVLGCVLAATSGAAFAGLDLPAPLALGVVLGVCSLVPYFGVLLGGAPAVLLALGSGEPRLGAGAAVVVVALQIVHGLALRSLLHPRSIVVGPALSLGGVLLGLGLYGAGGAAVAIPLVAFAAALLDEGLPERPPLPPAEEPPEPDLP